MVWSSISLGPLKDLCDIIVDGVWITLGEMSELEWIFVNVSNIFISTIYDTHSVDEEIWAIDNSSLLDGKVISDWVFKLVVGCSADIFTFQDGDGS